MVRWVRVESGVSGGFRVRGIDWRHFQHLRRRLHGLSDAIEIWELCHAGSKKVQKVSIFVVIKKAWISVVIKKAGVFVVIKKAGTR